MLHRNSPRLAEMLGEDDWFDKMSGIGRDQVRFAHMYRLHAFTDQQKKLILNGAGAKTNGPAHATNGTGPSADAKAIMACMREGFARLERSIEKLGARA